MSGFVFQYGGRSWFFLKFEAGNRNSNPNYFTQKERKEPLIVWSTENFGLEKKKKIYFKL